MDIKVIKNDRMYFWTNHSKYKLLQYNLSPSAVKKVLRMPERTEEGIAPETTAVMKRKDTKKTKREVWVMFQRKSKTQKVELKGSEASKIRIISTWIYPGVSPTGRDIYIPEDAWEEIELQK